MIRWEYHLKIKLEFLEIKYNKNIIKLFFIIKNEYIKNSFMQQIVEFIFQTTQLILL